MSGYPDVGDTSIPRPDELTPEVMRRAALNAAYRLERRPDDTTHSEVLDLLQALGLVASPSGGKTNPTGRNIPPAVQQKRREANAASKRRARDRKRNEKEAS